MLLLAVLSFKRMNVSYTVGFGCGCGCWLGVAFCSSWSLRYMFMVFGFGFDYGTPFVLACVPDLMVNQCARIHCSIMH